MGILCLKNKIMQIKNCLQRLNGRMEMKEGKANLKRPREKSFNLSNREKNQWEKHTPKPQK